MGKKTQYVCAKINKFFEAYIAYLVVTKYDNFHSNSLLMINRGRLLTS